MSPQTRAVSASASRMAALGIRSPTRSSRRGLVHHGRHDGGEFRRIQRVPDAVAQAFGDDEVRLGPDAGEPTSGRRCLVAGEVAALVEQARRSDRRCAPASRFAPRSGERRPSFSRSSRARRSAQRACSSRSGHRGRDGRAAPRAAGRCPRPSVAAPPLRRSRRWSAARVRRSVDARSRRSCGDRWLKCCGTRTRAEHARRRPGSRPTTAGRPSAAR